MEVMGVKDEHIVIVSFPLVMVVLAREEVSLFVGSSRLVVKCEVILRQLGDPSCLLSI